MTRFFIKISINALCFCLMLIAIPINAQEFISSDRNAMQARELFRRGVQAWNRYAYNDSIRLFEGALSYAPNEELILEWLGRAAYYSGLEESATRHWQSALQLLEASEPASIVISSYLENISVRRSISPELDTTSTYVHFGDYPGNNGDIQLYRQPSSVLAGKHGELWVVAYGSNEIVLLDVNGQVVLRSRGPINGFDRPYDMVFGNDGKIYVSEFKGNRISVLNDKAVWLQTFGSKGSGSGQFIGPQNLAVDSSGYLYVVDFGNMRVQKFTPEGEFVLEFGKKNLSFPGFKTPTGIACIQDLVVVADAAAGVLFSFDKNGSYLGVLAKENLKYPESLRADNDGNLLVADTRRILFVSGKSGLVEELGGPAASSSRVVSAAVDANGHIAMANFNESSVNLLGRVEDLSSGLFVQIQRVISDRFPEVELEVSVHNRLRQPISGLKDKNFFISENGYAVENQQLVGSGDLNTQYSLSVLLERSIEMKKMSDEIANSIVDLSKNATSVHQIVSAGAIPIIERSDTVDSLHTALRGITANYTDKWLFDMGLRLAATELLSAEKKRAVLFISTGTLPAHSFTTYGLSELAAYLANNNIQFYVALSSPSARIDAGLDYLCKQTGGYAFHIFNSRYWAPLLESIVESRTGTYTLRYTSALKTDFGRAFLPVRLEAWLLNRSGRDETAFFTPMQ